MATPHKWAPVIHAWADGATVQFQTVGGWSDASPNPRFDNQFLVFRIKPAPQTVTYRVALMKLNDLPWPLSAQSLEDE